MNRITQLEVLLEHGSSNQQEMAFNHLLTIAVENADINLLDKLMTSSSNSEGLNIKEKEIKTISDNYLKNVMFNNSRSSELLINYLKNEHMPNKKKALELFPIFEAINLASLSSNAKTHYSTSHYNYLKGTEEIVTLKRIINVAMNLERINSLSPSKYPQELKLAAGTKELIENLSERDYVRNRFDLDEIKNFHTWKLPYAFMNNIIELTKKGYSIIIEDDFIKGNRKGSKKRAFAELFMPLAEVQNIANEIKHKDVGKYTIQTKYGFDSEVFNVFHKYNQIFALNNYLDKIDDGIELGYKFWDIVEKPDPVAKDYAAFVADTYLNKLEHSVKPKK